MNWRGKLATIVNLIGSTRSRSGLWVRAKLDRGRYPGGVTVTDEQMATIRLAPHRFHGESSYTIHPAFKASSLISYSLTVPNLADDQAIALGDEVTFTAAQ
jgi:hypothetical protein